MGSVKSILAIDDVGGILVTIRSILRKYYKVSVAPTGAIGLQILKKTPIDLILLDIDMPEMDGFEFVEKMREDPAYNNIPIIFVTAETSVEFIAAAAKRGVHAYIVKPIIPKVLLSKIKEVFANQEKKK
jgi:putative two-component system response regulator